MGRHRIYRRTRAVVSDETVEEEAMKFYGFLEEKLLKKQMSKKELLDIYQSKYKVIYGNKRIPFSDIFLCLNMEKSLVQHFGGTVIFGTFADATILMLEGNIETRVETASEIESEDALANYECMLCEVRCSNKREFQNHQTTRKHTQQALWLMLKRDRNELTKSKNYATVTSTPAHDTNCVIEAKFLQEQGGEIVFTITNNAMKECLTIERADLLYHVPCFIDDDFKALNLKRKILILKPNQKASLTVQYQKNAEFGFFYVPVVFTLRRDSVKEPFHILRYLSVDVISDLYDDLAPKSPYRKPPIPVIHDNVKTVSGLELPKIQKDGLKMTRPLAAYKIPYNIRRQLKGGIEPMDELKHILEHGSTFENYQKKFSSLVFAEEIQMEKDIRNYDLHGVTFTQHRGRRLLVLMVPGLAENRPSLMRGDRIYAYEAGKPSVRYEGFVHQVEELDVLIGFHKNMPFTKGMKFDVEFTYSRLPIRVQLRAIECITKGSDLDTLLFPSHDGIALKKNLCEGLQGNWFDKNLNDEQKNAVEQIVKGASRPAPYLIYGPPGTGKTVTLVEAIKQVYFHQPNSIILACAPENSATDLIAERLLPHIDNKKKILRMYATSRPWEFVSQPLKDAGIVNYDMHKEIFYPEKEELMKNYRVITTTLISAGRLISGGIPQNHFTHIFIDEAGHAMEPQCLVPLASLLSVKHEYGGQVVLAGDPRQLGPVLRSPVSLNYGLDVSMLERMMHSPVYDKKDDGYDSRVLTKLLNNYRSHHSIIEVPNKVFYDGELRECAGEFRNVFTQWNELPEKNFPIIFHPVFGKDEREANSPSFFNVAEVETVSKYLSKLLDDVTRSKNIKFLKPSQVGIISPYKRQVQKLKTMIKKRRHVSDIKVGSVEEFQGQERAVIIISTVRSNTKEYLEMDQKFRLGFLKNPKRFNVAVTRAQALLIVVGNPEVLMKDNTWARFLGHCKANNAWVKLSKSMEMESVSILLKQMSLHTSDVPQAHDDASQSSSEEVMVSQRELQEQPEWKAQEY